MFNVGSFNLSSAQQYQQDVDVGGRYARDTGGLCEGLWVVLDELLAPFGGDGLEGAVVEASADADVFEAVHLLGLFHFARNVAFIFDFYLCLLHDFCPAWGFYGVHEGGKTG